MTDGRCTKMAKKEKLQDSSDKVAFIKGKQ